MICLFRRKPLQTDRMMGKSAHRSNRDLSVPMLSHFSISYKQSGHTQSRPALSALPAAAKAKPETRPFSSYARTEKKRILFPGVIRFFSKNGHEKRDPRKDLIWQNNDIISRKYRQAKNSEICCIYFSAIPGYYSSFTKMTDLVY